MGKDWDAALPATVTAGLLHFWWGIPIDFYLWRLLRRGASHDIDRDMDHMDVDIDMDMEMWRWRWRWRWIEIDIEIDSIYIWIWTYIYGYRYRCTCTYTDTYTDTDADIVLLSVRRNDVDEQPDSLLQASNSLWSAWSESASLSFSWACCFQISLEQLWYHDLLNFFCGSAADVFYFFCVTLGSFGFPGIWTRSRQR